MLKVDEKLKKYIEEKILPLYEENNIGGHGKAHIEAVIARSFELIEEFEELKKLDSNMVYVIAAFHDIGYKTNPDEHEEESAKIFKSNTEIATFFNAEQINIMAEAIAQHRASLNGEPNSDYGKLVSSADREISVENVLKRSISFQRDKHKHENPTDRQIIEYSYKKLSSKYGKSGYAKMYYQDQKYLDYLKQMQEILENKEKFIQAELKIMNENLRMNKIIVEVGSTCTKVDRYDGDKIEKLEGVTIQFKKHYNEDKGLRESDVKELIKSVNELKAISEDIYVCGTSIFRTLENTEKENFLKRFKNETGYEFNIISQESENELTVFGTTRFVNDKVCVFIGGGGSTEIAIYDKEIKETVNTKLGVIDVMQKFPDLAEDYAKTELEKVKGFIKERLNIPKDKSDILILAGGGHEKFARYSGIKYEENTLYNDKASPIMMDIETRKKETERYYKAISLDEIRNRVKDPEWWYATRAMSAFALVVAEAIGAKYIVPTDIAMAYGILEKNM